MSGLDAVLKMSSLAQISELHLAKNLHNTLPSKYLIKKTLSNSYYTYPNSTASFSVCFNSFLNENSEKLSHSMAKTNFIIASAFIERFIRLGMYTIQDQVFFLYGAPKSWNCIYYKNNTFSCIFCRKFGKNKFKEGKLPTTRIRYNHNEYFSIFSFLSFLLAYIKL